MQSSDLVTRGKHILFTCLYQTTAFIHHFTVCETLLNSLQVDVDTSTSFNCIDSSSTNIVYRSNSIFCHNNTSLVCIAVLLLFTFILYFLHKPCRSKIGVAISDRSKFACFTSRRLNHPTLYERIQIRRSGHKVTPYHFESWKFKVERKDPRLRNSNFQHMELRYVQNINLVPFFASINVQWG